MQNFSRIVQAVALLDWRRLLIVFTASLLLFGTTACTQPDTTASLAVPEATEAAVERAQGNLSDEAVDENALSRQSPSLARKRDGSTVSP